MKTIITENINDIGKIEKDWNKLIEITNSKNVYIDPLFYKKQFNTRAGKAKPYIVLFEKDNEPKGIIIGWIVVEKNQSKIGYFKFETLNLKILNIEIGGVLVVESEEYEKYIMDYLNKLLLAKKFDSIRANHFQCSNFLYKHFIKNAKLDNVVAIKGAEWFSEIRDKETGESINHNSSTTKSNFRRKDKKLISSFENVEVKEYKQSEDITEFIEKASQISKKSYHYALGVGIINNDYWKESLSAMAAGGYFRGYLLIVDNIPIAYYQGVVYKDIFYDFATSYNADYSKLSPGSFLLRRIIEICVQNEINIFHFGYGDAEHKKVYGNNFIEEATINIYGYTCEAKFSNFLNSKLLTLNDNAIEFLDKKGYLKKIKNLWRNLLRRKAESI